MNRRKVLIGGGTIGAALLGGLTVMGSATAEVESGLFGVSEEVEIDSNSGKLESFKLTDVTFVAEWSGFNDPAESATWELSVTHNNDTKVVKSVETSIENEQYEGSITEDVEDIDILQYFEAEDFEVEEDGETDSFDLEFDLHLEIDDVENSDYEDSVSGETIVHIENIPMDANVGGEASIEGEGETAYNDDYDPTDVDGVGQPRPNGDLGFRIDNENSVPVSIKLETDGDSDEDTYTVGANNYGSNGRIIGFDEKETITGIKTKPQNEPDAEYEDSGFSGTASPEDE